MAQILNVVLDSRVLYLVYFNKDQHMYAVGDIFQIFARIFQVPEKNYKWKKFSYF